MKRKGGKRMVSGKELAIILVITVACWIGMFLVFYFNPELRKMRRHERELKRHQGAKPFMACDMCGKEGVQISRVTEAYGKGNSLLIIENIPMVNCPRCAESYFTAETLREIERIKLHRESIAVERPVKIACLGR